MHNASKHLSFRQLLEAVTKQNERVFKTKDYLGYRKKRRHHRIELHEGQLYQAIGLTWKEWSRRNFSITIKVIKKKLIPLNLRREYVVNQQIVWDRINDKYWETIQTLTVIYQKLRYQWNNAGVVRVSGQQTMPKIGNSRHNDILFRNMKVNTKRIGQKQVLKVLTPREGIYGL